MFDALRKKISSWLGPKEEKVEKKTKKVAKAEKKTKKEKKLPKEIKVKKRISVEKQLKEKSDSIKEEVPTEFKPGTLSYQPELEAIKEKTEEKLEQKTELKKEAEEEKVEEQKEKKSWWPFGKKKEKEERIEKKDEIKEKTEEVKGEQKENFFTRLVKKITKSELKQEDFDEIFSEMELILLENNVALEVVDKIKQEMSQSLVGKEIKEKEAENFVLESLKNAILSVLQEPPDIIELIKKHQGIYTILFFGINGSGKTTSIAKLAYNLKKEGISCVLAAGDTFRAASIEQLKTHANKLEVPIIAHDYGSDPAAVAFDAKKYAQQHDIKVVLIDTAGRMYTKSNLMREMEKIVRISNPNLKIFVAESITGNDAVDQAKNFNETAGIDGIILTKADVDEKAGTILSVSQVTNKPIFFLGTGQTYDDLTPFTKSAVLKNLGLE